MKLLIAVQLNDFRSSRADFYEDLAEMFEAKQNFRSFLDRQYEVCRRTGQTSHKKAYEMIIARFDANEGAASMPLSYLLSGVVPEVDMVALPGIDQTDHKEQGLRELAANIRRQKEIIRVLWTYLALPLLIIPFIAFISAILGTVILEIERVAPVFVREEVFPPWSFNWVVRLLAHFTEDYDVHIIVALCSAVVTIILFLPTFTGVLRLRIDTWPGASLYRDYQAARFFSSLSMLLTAQVKLIPALESLGQVGSPWMRWQIRRILSSLEEEPTQYTEAFARGVCSPYVEGRLQTYYESIKQREARGDMTATFADALIRLGGAETERTTAKIKGSAIAINTVLMSGLFIYAGVLGLGSMTVPGKFSELMDPNRMILLKQQYEAKKQAAK